MIYDDALKPLVLGFRMMNTADLQFTLFAQHIGEQLSFASKL
jgi:hypothetical protein